MSVAVLLAVSRYSDSLDVITVLVGGLLCLGVMLVFGSFIGAYFLQLACRIISVPVPGYSGAVGVEIAERLCNLLLYFALLLASVSGAASKGPLTDDRMQYASLTTFVLSQPLQLLVAAGIYSSLIEGVSFVQGLLLWFVKLVIAFAIGFILLFAVLTALFVLGAVAHR